MTRELAPNFCLSVLAAWSGQPDVTDSSSFYDIWEAFNLLKGMCVRYEMSGKISGLGREGKLTMLLLPYVAS